MAGPLADATVLLPQANWVAMVATAILFVLIVQLPGQKNKRRQERKTTEGFFL
jgi:hypothetical protein